MNDLVEAAIRAREVAYAPYSGYQVGAAVKSSDGRIFSGCNVENVSFGASVCAERNAIFHMVAEGGLEVSEIAVVTRDGGTPCGICRQVMLEFSPDPGRVKIFCYGMSEGKLEEYVLADLIPHGFKTDLPRT